MTEDKKTSEEPSRSDAPRPARLLDVARLAKVSRATAARALGGYGTVTEETRERVSAAAKTLNYRLNEVARAMRAGRTQAIGVILADISNSFFANAARAIIDISTAHGYQALILNSADDPEREVEAVRVLVDKRVDGLIVAPSSFSHNAHLSEAGALSGRIVLFDRGITDLKLSTVTSDDRRGAREAVSLLIARGHRRIGLLVSTAAIEGHGPGQPRQAVSTVRDRVAGARDALKAAGLDLPPAWLRYSRNDVAVVSEAALSILGSEPRPTALLASCEEMTIGILAACRQLGLAVGKDIALISFDESPWLGVLTPAISVVRRPIEAMVSTAVGLLVRQIEAWAEPQSIALANELVVRESVFDHWD
ncbi:LacI family DNA-binding transcriptional regulator [Labrys neptuniae]